MSLISVLEKHRQQYHPKLPQSLRQGIRQVSAVKGISAEPPKDKVAIKSNFPHSFGLPLIQFEAKPSSAEIKPLNVGVVLSGGQAPGGHNVIAGIFDSIKVLHPDSQLFGFLGGPSGLEKGKYEIIDQAKMNAFRNTGGFDIIGSGRTKLETTEQFDCCIDVIKKLNIHAIVIIGGDDSNTNAAVLAEYFQEKNVAATVTGVPKTIDGDLKNAYIPVSFGFDTAVKTYAELIGNIARDASSAKKYWHFIKLMGRSASHIALEAALQTHANVTLISEEVLAKKQSLDDVVTQIADAVKVRADKGKNYGVVLVPEGLIEFIPSFNTLISQLNDLLAHHEIEFTALTTSTEKVTKVLQWLGGETLKTFLSLPPGIQIQLLLDRDPHGNVQVSQIDTEKLLSELVGQKLKASNDYKGKFSAQHHFFGYEGRAAAPSNFDADYCYSLGCTAAVLLANGLTGYMASIRDLSKGVDAWTAGGIPISMLFNMEQRHGKMKPVIQKALVELTGPAFLYFAKYREVWAVEDSFLYPGPIQYFGPSEVCDVTNQTLLLENT